MIHELTIGHLDPEAIPNRLAIAMRPLDAATVARVLAEFPGLKVERRDGYLIAPWHGREDADRGRSVRRAHAGRDGLPGRRPAERADGRAGSGGRREGGGIEAESRLPFPVGSHPAIS
jgi:hypothetical protein